MSTKIREVAADELDPRFLALVKEVAGKGEEIVLMDSGKPLARVTPLRGVPSLYGSVLYQGDLISPVIDWPEEE